MTLTEREALTPVQGAGRSGLADMLSNSFVTTVSGDGNPYLKVQFATLPEVYAFSDALKALVSLPPVSDTALREALEALPRRKEKISGQTFSYVKLEDVLTIIDGEGRAP